MNNQLRNVLVCTDAYKASHFKQIPPDAEASRFYLAPRRKLLGAEYDDFIMFGLSYFIKKYLERPITEVDIQYAHKIWDHFNVGGGAYPFPYEAFQRIVDDFDGRLPITIAGIPEGMAFSEYNTPIAIIECHEPDLTWLPGFIETALQRAVWYGSTTATISRNVRKYLHQLYEKTVKPDDFFTLDFRLHDFGARGVSSGESAALGGLAHLINFNGTDTMEGVVLGTEVYNIDVAELACSIPAAEHSTVTCWGSDMNHERKALENMIKHFGDGPLFAFVSDSYDYKRFVREVWCHPDIIDDVRKAGATPVVRPDSGDPNEMVLYGLTHLADAWGYEVNDKGYKVLNGINVIQGDGMNSESVVKMYEAVTKAGFSPQNVAVGMGGGLLQKHNRDFMSWSMKMFQIKRDGLWHNVQKTPVTQPEKKAWNPSNGVNSEDFISYYDHGKINPDIFDFKAIRRRARDFTEK